MYRVCKKNGETIQGGILIVEIWYVLHIMSKWGESRNDYKVRTFWEAHIIWKSSSWFWCLPSKSADLSKPWGRFFQILCVSQKVRTLKYRYCEKATEYEKIKFPMYLTTAFEGKRHGVQLAIHNTRLFLHFPNELCYGYLRFEGNGKIPLGR